MNLVSAFLEQAAAAPQRPALIECCKRRDRIATYGDLDAQSARVAGFLQSRGLRQGDVVLIFVPMSTALYATLIGIWRLGAVALFVDPAGGRALIDRACAIAAPRAFVGIGKAHAFRLVSSGVRQIRLKIAIGARFLPSVPWRQLERAAPHDAVADPPAEHPALLTFTSGSTSTPKAASRSHRLLLAQRDAIRRSLALEPGEVDLATLPIFALANLACGLTTVIPNVDLSRPGHIDAARALACIGRHCPTRSSASPQFFMRLCERCAETGEALPFNKVYTGGAPVFPRNLEAIARAAPHAVLTVLYGSTEAEPISHVSLAEIEPADFDRMRAGQGLLAGPPTPETATRILRDLDGTPIPSATEAELDALSLPPNQIGEIAVSGDHVLPGYLNGEGDAENKIRVGASVWHRSGDAGYFDERGRLWLLGRCRSKIATPDGPLYPFAVETAASLDPRVAWAALTEIDGQPTLAIQLAPGAPPPDLASLNFPFPAIQRLEIVKRMPLDKRHNAKIDYPRLQALLAPR